MRWVGFRMTDAMLAGYWSLLLSLKAMAFLFPFLMLL